MTNQEFRTAALAQLPTCDAKGHPYENYSDKALLFELEAIEQSITQTIEDVELLIDSSVKTQLIDELLEMQEQGYWFEFDIEEASLDELQAAYDYYVSPDDMAEAAEECAAHPRGTSNDSQTAIKTVAKASAKVHYAFKTMPWNAIAGNCLLLAVQACYYLAVAVVWTIDLGVRCRKAYEGSQLQATLRTLQALDKAAWDYVAIRRTVRGTYESRLIEELLLGK